MKSAQSFFEGSGFVGIPRDDSRIFAPLEHALLSNPACTGVFLLPENQGENKRGLTKFRFVCRGDMDSLTRLAKSFLGHLGFDTSTRNLNTGSYDRVRDFWEDNWRKRGVPVGGMEDMEKEIGRNWAPLFFLSDFPPPLATPWCVERTKEHAAILHVIVDGKRAIHLGVHSCDRDRIRRDFDTAAESDKATASLCNRFGKPRVSKELDELLSLSFVPFFSGTIFVENLMDGMKAILGENTWSGPARELVAS